MGAHQRSNRCCVYPGVVALADELAGVEGPENSTRSSAVLLRKREREPLRARAPPSIWKTVRLWGSLLSQRGSSGLYPLIGASEECGRIICYEFVTLQLGGHSANPNFMIRWRQLASIQQRAGAAIRQVLPRLCFGAQFDKSTIRYVFVTENGLTLCEPNFMIWTGVTPCRGN